MKKIAFSSLFGLCLYSMTLQSCQKDVVTPTNPSNNDSTFVDTTNNGNNPIDSTGWNGGNGNNPGDTTAWNGGNPGGNGNNPGDSTDWNGGNNGGGNPIDSTGGN